MTTPAVTPDRTGFARLLHAEWTKFRTVRGWVIAMVAGVLAIVALGWLIASGSRCVAGPPGQDGQACPSAPVGPGGEYVTDTFYFVRQPLGANGSITVRVTSLAGLYNPSGQVPPGEQNIPMAGMVPGVQPWAKAGIIITGGTRPGSAYVAMMATGGHGVRMQWDYTQDSPGLPGRVGPASPRWLRLTRSGDTITGYDSADGTTWTEVGTATLAGLPSTVQAGLFATSPPNSQVSTQSFGASASSGGPTLATAAFDHIGLHGSWPARAWAGQLVADSSSVVIPGAETFRQADGRITVTGTGNIGPAAPDGPGAAVGAPLVGTFAGLIAAVVVGAMFMTAEYRRGLIRVTFAASPRRGQVLAAKALVIGAVTFAAGLAAAAIAVPVGLHVLHDNGSAIIPVTVLAGLQVIGGTAVLLAAAAVLALAVGTVLRRSAAAVAFGIVVIVLPYLLGTTPGVLPAGAEEWLLRVTPAAAFAIQQTIPAYPRVPAFYATQYVPTNGYFPLAPWAGLAVLCGYAAAALALAVFVLRRRDA